MSIQPKLLGYFILPHDNSDGFASSSLKDLLKSNASELKFPFLNQDRLTKCRKGIQRKSINNVEVPSRLSDNMGWSPTGRFLYQMSGKLEIPTNRLIITTNRRIMIEIIKFGQYTRSMDLTLKTKLKNHKYGKTLQISHVRPAEYNSYKHCNTRQHSEPFGIKFGLYLINDDTKNTKKDATLFSIHCLQIDEVCFIYEAEIDAIQHSKDDEGVNDLVSIYEIKTNSYKEEIQNIFKEYYECSKTQTLSHDQMKSALNKIEDTFLLVGPKSTFPFRQGELGNIHKFIYGFHHAQNQSALSCVIAEEFDCYPGTFLSRDASYLLDFVHLLNESGLLSHNYGLTWDKWQSWKLTKNESSVTLERDGERSATLRNWERV